MSAYLIKELSVLGFPSFEVRERILLEDQTSQGFDLVSVLLIALSYRYYFKKREPALSFSSSSPGVSKEDLETQMEALKGSFRVSEPKTELGTYRAKEWEKYWIVYHRKTGNPYRVARFLGKKRLAGTPLIFRTRGHAYAHINQQRETVRKEMKVGRVVMSFFPENMKAMANLGLIPELPKKRKKAGPYLSSEV